MADLALRPELRQLGHGVEIGGMLIHPPMELQQVDALESHAGQAALDAGAHDRWRHGAGLGAPFGEGGGRLAAGAGDLAAPRQIEEAAGDDLGAAVVIGHVEAVEAGRGIAGHGRGTLVGIEGGAVALHIGDLPEAGDHAADLEIGREANTGRESG